MKRYNNEEILDRYLNRYLNERYSDNTSRSYYKVVTNMFAFLDNKSIFDITFFDVDDFIEDMKCARNRLGEKTKKINVGRSINKYISAINSFFVYCEEFKILEDKLHFKFMKDSQQKNRKKQRDGTQMTPEIWEKILNENDKHFLHYENYTNTKDRAILYLGMKCGLRKSEIINIKHSDITIVTVDNEEMVKIEINNAKGNKFRDVYLNMTDYNVINNLLIAKKFKGLDCEYLICTTNNKKVHKDARTLWDVVQKCSKRAGITKDGEVLTYTPHQMRHGFVTYMMSQPEADLLTISQYIGHSDITITSQIYTHDVGQKAKVSLAKLI